MNRFESSLSLQGLFSGDNRKPTIILLLTPILLTTFKYYGSKDFFLANFSLYVTSGNVEFLAALYVFLSSFLILGIIPLLIVRFVFKEPLKMYGVALGDWRFGWGAFAIMTPVLVVLTYPSSTMPDFLAEYPINKEAGTSAMMFATHAGLYFLFYLGWEFFFRGFLQFGLREKLGDWYAILVQVLASCLLHIGKPDGEIYFSIFGGLVAGIVVFRSRSLLYILLVHWLLGVSLDVFIIYF